MYNYYIEEKKTKDKKDKERIKEKIRQDEIKRKGNIHSI